MVDVNLEHTFDVNLEHQLRVNFTHFHRVRAHQWWAVKKGARVFL